MSAELMLYSMEKNKPNLVGFEREFFDIQKEHYEKEIQERDISKTERVIVLQCKIKRGRYEDKLHEAMKIFAKEHLSFVKKLQGLKVNYIHVCNTYEVLQFLFGEFTNNLDGKLMDKLRIPSSGVFVTTDDLSDIEFDPQQVEILESKGDDLLAIGQWDFKDLLVEAPIHFAEDYVKFGQRYLGIKCITLYPDQITDITFNEILEQSKFNLIWSIHMLKENKGEVIKDTQNRLDKINRKLVYEIKNRGTNDIEADNLKQSLLKLNGDTNNFLVKMYFGIMEKTFDNMSDGVAYIDKLLESKNIQTYLPSLEMKDAFLSLMPFGYDFFDKKLDVETRIGENLITQALSCVNVFQGTDLTHTTKRAFRYGYDRDTNNFIVADRVSYLKSPAGLILGTPGQGKSSSAKHEIDEAILTAPPGDQIFTVDYIGEYTPICKKFGYPEMFFDYNSGTFINPLDLNPYALNPLSEKADKFVEWLEILLYRSFDNIELTAIDNAFHNAFADKGVTVDNQHEIFKEKTNYEFGSATVFGSTKDKVITFEDTPLLEDFQKCIATEGPKGKYIAEELEIYVTGTHKYLNQKTTLNIDARFINFNLTTVRDRMKPAIFYLIKEKLEEKGKFNFKTKNKRIMYLYYDEMHKYFRNAKMGTYIALDYKEGRKEGLVPTGITQNVQDLLRYDDGVLCLVNADFILLLGTDKASRDIIAKHIEISKEESDAFNKEVCNAGDGLLIFGGDRIPIHISCSEWELREFDTRAFD